MPVRGATMKKTTLTEKNNFLIKLMVFICFVSLKTIIYVEGDGTGQCVTCVQEDLKNELVAITSNITANLTEIDKFFIKGECDPHRMERYAFFAQRELSMMYQPPVGHCQSTNRVSFNATENSLPSKDSKQISSFDMDSGKFTVPVDGTYFFEFHAVKAPRWNPTSRADKSKCVVKLVKEHLNVNTIDINKPNVTLTPIAEGKVIAEDWYSSFPIQIEAIVQLVATEIITVQIYDGELLGGWLTSFTGFLLEKTDKSSCTLI